MLFTFHFHRKALVSFTSRTLNCFFLFHKDLLLFFTYAFSLNTNKEDLLHVTHCITSLLPFGQNSFISKLFQCVLSLIYECVLFN